MSTSTRRDFLKTVTSTSVSVLACGAAAQAAGGSSTPRKGRNVAGLTAPPLDTVRWGLIGVGNRGRRTLRDTLLLEHCEVRALCDNHVKLDYAASAVAGIP